MALQDIRQSAANIVGGIGSTLGLPEFGISEAIGNNPAPSTAVLQTAPQYQSTTVPLSTIYETNSSGGVGGAYPIAGGTGTTSGQVLGTNTTNQSGGGSSGGSSGNQYRAEDRNKTWFINEFGQIQDIIQPDYAAIEAQFNPVFDVLNKAESNLRGQVPGLISEAERQAEMLRTGLSSQRTGAEEQLGLQEQQTQRGKEKGIAEQRQTLQELQQANQARFGGASSAGLAASELQGREFQRGTAGIAQQAQQALQQINTQKSQVLRDYNQGLQQVETNLAAQKNQIQRDLQDRLLEIDRQRGAAAQDKAAARLDALNNYKNAAYQLSVQKLQMEAELRNQAQQNVSYLDSTAQQYLQYAQQGQQAANQFSAYTPSSIPQVSGQGTSSQTPYVGSIRPEDMVGSIAGSSATDPRFQNYQPFTAR